MLDARRMWNDPKEYDRAAQALAARFRKNFTRFGEMPAEILAAAPRGE
jgi:ATP-dependent phosphoenolpyruvate carboxykinase